MKKPIVVVGGIFLAVLLLRLVLAFMIPEFTYESYFHLRQVEHIVETGLPFYQDQLSYGGRELAFLPFFHYLAALFGLAHLLFWNGLHIKQANLRNTTCHNHPRKSDAHTKEQKRNQPPQHRLFFQCSFQ